jgi:RNA polymerase sigma-70 factor (ECF subfamily)
MQSETPVEEMAETIATPGNTMENAENRSVIQDAFSVLTEEERNIVTMTIYGEYDSGEIAKMLGLNRNTVRSKYSRALSKMRDRIGAR